MSQSRKCSHIPSPINLVRLMHRARVEIPVSLPNGEIHIPDQDNLLNGSVWSDLVIKELIAAWAFLLPSPLKTDSDVRAMALTATC